MLKKIWSEIVFWVSWVVVSAKDPDKVSLTLKAGIPFLVMIGFGTPDSLGQATDSIGHVLLAAAQLVSGVMTAWGLIRKIILTFRNRE